MEYSERNSTKFINIIVFTFFVLVSVSFMEIFKSSLTDYLQIIALILVFVLILINTVYSSDKPHVAKSFNIPIILILFSVLLSMLGALIFHNQSFKITAVVQRSVYFYILYYALHHFSFKPSLIIKIIFGIGVFHVFIYFLQYFMYPNVFLDCRVILDRNTIRIYMPGTAYAIFTFLFSLHIFFHKYQPKYIILCLIMLLLFLFGGSRQVLGSVLLTTILYLLITKRIKNKVLVVIVAFLGVIPFYFMVQDLLISLIDVSKNQSTNFEDNIRFAAMRFYLIDFMPNKIAYLTGNGAPSKYSAYGRVVMGISETKGLYLSDIGIIGEYFKYGLLFVTTQLFVLFRILFMKMPDSAIPIRFIVIIVLMTLFTGTGAFGNDDNIVFMCILFYMIDIAKSKQFSSHELNELFTT